jgi:integrase/recombinase XerD
MTTLQTDASDYIAWLQVHNYAPTTIASRARYLAYFTWFCETHSVLEPHQVSFELLQAYQQHLYDHRTRTGAPLTVATQAQRLIPVTHFFNWLRRSGRLEHNPASDLLMPKGERRLPEATLSASEMARLLSAPTLSRPLGLRDRAILETFYSSALRRGELIALTPTDIDFARGTIFIRHGKGAKDRYVPIGERALFWLRLYLDLSRPRLATDNTDSGHLFISSHGTPLCPDWLSRRVRRYLAIAGITKNGSCHLLRHTVATLMLEGGADIRYVAEMLGHARLETTQRYTRVSIDRLRQIHTTTHPAAGLNVALATEICAAIPHALALAPTTK